MFSPSSFSQTSFNPISWLFDQLFTPWVWDRGVIRCSVVMKPLSLTVTRKPKRNT